MYCFFSEIAALLSCLVFQQRNCSPPELTKPLETGVEAIKKCALVIGQTQRACGMKASEQDYVDQFNFGLVEVVYEWARGKPFGEIVGLTDVQVRNILIYHNNLKSKNSCGNWFFCSFVFKSPHSSIFF